MTLLIFQLVVLILSAMIHEVAHGAVANALGDPTAKLAGRLNLNPLNHLDPFGSIILPLILAIPTFFGQPAFIIAWAKPVPYNPANLRRPLQGSALIAAAGPLSNIAIAAILGFFIRLGASFAWGESAAPLMLLFSIVVSLNLLLAVFNLLPIPPLDGAKVLGAFLPSSWRLRLSHGGREFVFWIRRNQLLFLIILFFSLQYLLGFLAFIVRPPIALLYRIFTGFPFPLF